jgi:hypothetical protein
MILTFDKKSLAGWAQHQEADGWHDPGPGDFQEHVERGGRRYHQGLHHCLLGQWFEQ